MNDNYLPKYSKIYILNKKVKCQTGEEHHLVKKSILMYNEQKTTNNEVILECSNCKKLFIVEGNKDRFFKNYPLYEIVREKIEIKKKEKMSENKNNQQDSKKISNKKRKLSEREIKLQKRKEKREKNKIKKKKIKEQQKRLEQELERKKRVAEIARMNSPEEKRKQKIKKLIDSNKIEVLYKEHEHNTIKYSCTVLTCPMVLYYCEECNILYCLNKEYNEYIKKGVPTSKFSFKMADLTPITSFNKKPKKGSELEKEKKAEKIERKETFKYVTEKPLTNKTLLVKTSNRECIYKDHSVKGVNVNIDILNNYNQKIVRTIPAFECRQCGILYIYDSQFYELIEKGQPLCLIVDQRIYQDISKKKNFYYGTDSILTLYGYNVNQNANLKTTQRQNILKTLVNTKIIRKDVAISHLRWLIRQRSNRKNHKKAIAKWEEDIDFLIHYDIDTNVNYTIDTIINKSRMY